ncbi:Eco57I restriction-modification methylase domain-containing protein [Campylobacter ureolyticus]|uniref:Eco57I restriction-modification methylase domain-containing protein n=1 Tax=Campylobacter ureolyticus TaxID=827 RepID=UPI0029078CFE|nr:N-6 DNA methylase [Campylobacter ureolyticus]MDU5325409.1 N-6 DNA methylase [Campylobacter ureolyticus]
MFQEKIVESSIKNLDENKLLKAYDEFKKFQDKKDAIKTFKEIIYQDGFLKDVFENALGYTLNITNPLNFNLRREMKNETDAGTVDGVIIVNNEVIGVIELKDTNTKDLNKVEIQAFNYHNSHANSRFIIISNFAKLRFYIDKKVEFVEFDLFNLNFNEFKKFYLLLSFESIKNQIPLILKEKSLNFENEISKKLYKDYSNFRLNLFENLIINNPQVGKHELLSHTSKLCDRIIFILFAEDKALLKPNTIKTIEEDFKNQKYTNFSLYEMYKFYFNAINKGDEKLGIKAYNGGLFASDEALDSLLIDDDALNASKLSQYDFASEISVNILGHIFEQSLNDLEEITANIHGDSFDKTKSQRKKDGIFYTPEFITKFIVSKTLGEICKPKREILENLPLPKNKDKLTKNDKINKNKFYEYKDFLLNLKILDPACGSGAFLNEAMNFLINEHKFCDDLRNQIYGYELGLYDVETAVLEKNLYGVDINQTATEIAKLSLWLRSAQVGRKLTNLSNNIKTANSLLDFPFKDIKFNAVIGNPPYVRQERIKEQKPFLEKIYEIYNGTADLYVYFYELGIKNLKESGYLGFICSNKFFRAKYGENLREFLLKNTSFKNIVDFNEIKIFEDATVDSAITVFKKEINQNNEFKFSTNLDEKPNSILQSSLDKTTFTFLNNTEISIKSKLEKKGTPLKNWDIQIYRGVLTGLNEAFIIDTKTRDELLNSCQNLDEKEKTSNLIKPILRGRDIKRYSYEWANLWLINTHNGYDEFSFIDINEYPTLKNYLDKFEPKLSKRADKGKTPYNLRNCAYLGEFEKDKIIYSEIVRQPQFYLDKSKQFFAEASSFVLTGENLYYLLCLLHSKFITYCFKNFYAGGGLGVGYRYKKAYLENLPIPQIPADKMSEFENLANELLNLNENLKTTKNAFLTELNLDKLPKTLENFELLEFDEFIDEFTKALKLKFKDKLDERNFKNQWERIFMNDKNEVLNLQSKISKLDKNADDLVYKLFDLSDYEIKFIENEMR